MDGAHFDAQGKRVGHWKSAVVGIQDAEREIIYHWTGERPPSQDGGVRKATGFGTLEFEEGRLVAERGRGHFIKLDPSDVGTTQWKTVLLRRVGDKHHTVTMRERSLAEKKVLVGQVLEAW